MLFWRSRKGKWQRSLALDLCTACIHPHVLHTLHPPACAAHAACTRCMHTQARFRARSHLVGALTQWATTIVLCHGSRHGDAIEPYRTADRFSSVYCLGGPRSKATTARPTLRGHRADARPKVSATGKQALKSAENARHEDGLSGAPSSCRRWVFRL